MRHQRKDDRLREKAAELKKFRAGDGGKSTNLYIKLLPTTLPRTRNERRETEPLANASTTSCWSVPREASCSIASKPLCEAPSSP